ncbi:MAG: hypothetical protein IT383_26410 [Deltaproteobacteria bacterium]|nr:hypothetical protein [Deltaproteobacteria bacterium]
MSDDVMILAKTPATFAASPRSRRIDEAVARELLANARDELLRDAGLGFGLVLGATVSAFWLGSVAVGVAVLVSAPIGALELARRFAVRRRRRRCRELGVDTHEADRLFARVDLLRHVALFHAMSQPHQAALVARIVAGDLQDTGTHGAIASSKEPCPKCGEPGLEVVQLITWTGRNADGSREHGATSYARCTFCSAKLKMEIGWPWKEVTHAEWEKRSRVDDE